MLYSVTKLTYSDVAKARCKHMFWQMHSMNDPTQSYAVHECPIALQGVLLPKSNETVVNMVTGLYCI